MQVEITIQAGEGGKDARLLVAQQSAIYEAYAAANDLTLRKDSGTGS